jgi:hypothetical protein
MLAASPVSEQADRLVLRSLGKPRSAEGRPRFSRTQIAVLSRVVRAGDVGVDATSFRRVANRLLDVGFIECRDETSLRVFATEAGRSALSAARRIEFARAKRRVLGALTDVPLNERADVLAAAAAAAGPTVLAAFMAWAAKASG